jgi:phosphoglycolate phosphatase
LDILVDLDGTMIDPKPGIVGSVQYALTQLGEPVPLADDLHWVIGPPLRRTFAQLGLSAERVEEALTHYRDNYRAGAMYDFRVYDGMHAALASLARNGHRLIVATSKPHVFARPIIEHAGLSRFYAAIHGAELDGRNDDKADLIAHISAVEGVASDGAVMVGDRLHDVVGAKRNGIPCIGVTWGYGTREELLAAGAVSLCPTPGDLAAAVEALPTAKA